MREVAERLLAKVEQSENGCLIFTGVHAGGYGRLSLRGRLRQAHRIAYELFVGPIPLGLEIDHLCRNRSCVNPSHLEPVTRRVNVLRGEGPAGKKARQTHCKRGHAFDEENTYVDPRGGRHCRECHRALNRSEGMKERRRERNRRKRELRGVA